MADLQGDVIATVLDNCPAHAVDYNTYTHINSFFLPPNMTSNLQTVDSAIRRSFKCAVRRLLVDHILHYVDSQFSLPASD